MSARARFTVAAVSAIAVFLSASALTPRAAFADGDAGAPTDAGAPATESVNGCVESIPSGGQRPTITDTVPDRGFSGYAATLTVTIDHGKGETVLPNGLALQSAGDAAKVLKEASFVIPTIRTAAPRAQITSEKPAGNAARRTGPEDRPRALPLVPLPAEPGRHLLILPPVPVAVARANGEIATVCTRRHRILIEDPIASVNDARPKPNPPARVQREEWTSLKKGLLWAGGGLVVGALVAYLALPLAHPPEARAASAAAAPAVGGRPRAPRRDAPRRAPRSRAVR